MTEFWAKTTSNGDPGISVLEHLLNVGAVARRLAELDARFLERCGLAPAPIAALAALHDLGKISPGFQQKCPTWLRKNDLETVARDGCWDTNQETRHAMQTQAATQRFLVAEGIGRKSSSVIAAVLGAHHGRIQTPPNERGFPAISENHSGIDWEARQSETAREVLATIGCRPSQLVIKESSPALWWMAGLTAVADWIGSDERFFLPEHGAKSTDRQALAREAIAQIGLDTPSIVPGLTFAELFDFPATAIPNDMQVRAVATITGPGVHVIEAPMGMGKTEAALWAAYEILRAGKARGIYFALPTQATSNRIHLRMAQFIQRIAPDSVSSRLIHGNSWLSESVPLPASSLTISGNEAEGASEALDWFASARRALLAPFGVGTVDQALLAVVAAKHFFVRHFALASKVVIVDEVHSYDLYTGTLIDRLVSVLEGLGCTVIILSATLTGMRRDQLVSAPTSASSGPVREDYPLLVSRTESGTVASGAAPPPPQTVDVAFSDPEESEAEALTLAARGGVILWIANTVDSAQQVHTGLVERSEGRVPVGLLHSRFPFWRRAELEDEWMERLGKSSVGRCGCILVSTQIVEQSVDLDADLLITELAPTDMLFQRLGRLWRHKRENRPFDRPQLRILAESSSLDALRRMDVTAIMECLGGKGYVYSPHVLLRTLDVWKGPDQIVIPDEIRARIEATYCDRDDEPDAWKKLRLDREQKAIKHRSKALQSLNVWSVALDDDEGVQTRLDEQPTVTLLLCRSINANRIELIDGSQVELATRKILLQTARAVHRNVVRIPLHCFDTLTPRNTRLALYLHGLHAIAIASPNGSLDIGGLKPGVRLSWSTARGVVIKRASARSTP